MFSKSLYSLTIILILLTSNPAMGRMLYSLDEADSGLTSNSYIEIIYHDDILWMAGGRGLSYSPDGGLSWYTYDAETGLSSNEPSAIFGRPGQLWVAMSHTEPYQGVNFPFGDGFNLTYDNGDNWESQTPIEASGFGKICYDLAGNEQSTYASCFHGGLIVSHDAGQNWSHMFFSPVDSADWAADNWADLVSGRYYACYVDTSHADTMIVYGGTGKGIQKFLYIPQRVKQGGNNITAIAGNDDFIYVAHENGVSQSDTALNIFHTSSPDNGLPSHWLRELFVFGNKVWVAPFDPLDTSGLGLYYVDNADQLWSVFDSSITGPGDFWSKHLATYFEGDGSGIYDFKNYNDSILYVAAGDSGVFRTLDFGSTWERFYVDSADMNSASLHNQVLSIDVTADTVFLGTRAGLVKASYVPPFTFDFDTLITFEENDSTGSVVSIVRHNNESDTSGEFSYKWIAVEPIDPASDSGNYAAIQIHDQTDNDRHILYSNRSTPTIINDIAVSDSFTTFATSTGLSGNYNINVGPTISSFSFITNDVTTGQTLVSYRFQTAEWIGDRLFAGSTGGFAYWINNTSWRVFRTNTDPLIHDLAVVRNRANSGLPGDWVVALDQQIFGSDTILWAACRGIADTVQQYNSVAYSTDFGDSWTRVLTNEMVWNFAFDQNGGAYAAASSGLFYAPDSRDEWQKAPIIDPFAKDTIWNETEVYSLEVVDSTLWVGTSFGIANRPIDNVENWDIIRVFKLTDAADDVFAAPVPFSPLNPNGRLTIHYRVEQSANITVEIYDFAMNLVAVPTEDRFRDAGEDYFETWDGYNMSGEVVATGMYFFKVSYSTGDEYWGRLAIIP